MNTAYQSRKQTRIATSSDATVLITGPTGSGKTRLARELHERGRRSGRPFVVVNLASLHEGTLESELFGHERGAYTGADTRRCGKLELANGGTVFLDEIGELTPRLQARLLEFLQSKTICPLGGNREVRLDVRVIAATHRDLKALTLRREFREDLFHRLRVVTIELPSLRERDEDFGDLVHSVLSELASNSPRAVLGLSSDVARCFETYSWPGNVRELRNVLEYALLSTEDGRLKMDDLPPWFLEAVCELTTPDVRDPGDSFGTSEFSLSTDYQRAIASFEAHYLRVALRRFRGRINLTARSIGMNKTTLIRRLREHQISIDALFLPQK